MMRVGSLYCVGCRSSAVTCGGVSSVVLVRRMQSAEVRCCSWSGSVERYDILLQRVDIQA